LKTSIFSIDPCKVILNGMIVGLVLTPKIGHGQTLNWKYLNDQVTKRIQITGYRKLGFHVRSLSGDREAQAVQNDSGLGDRRFTDIGQITLAGRRVFGVINFDATIQDSRFNDPQGQKFSIDYLRDGWQINLGDIQGSLLNTNRFASFSRQLRGVQVGYRKGNFAFKTLTSQAKAQVQTVSLNGNGSSGPYYLNASQILADSERVRVDGQDLVRGRDYVISYEIGSITFTDRTVGPSSTILVTFESLGFNSPRGTIEGAGVSYDFGKAGRLGFSAMRQKSRAGSSLSQRIDRFFGFGSVEARYTLQLEPNPGSPILITVNGIPQTEGVNYIFVSENRAVFRFTRFMPSTDLIDVQYTPRPRQTVDGDREVTGFDYRIAFGGENKISTTAIDGTPATTAIGRAGYLQYTQARGALKNEVNPTSGVARGLNAEYNFKDFRLNLNARDIPAGYVAIESRNFNRNERAHDIGVIFTPKPEIRYGVQQNNSAITTRVVGNNNSLSFTRSRATELKGFVSFQTGASGQPWELSHSRRKSGSNRIESSADVTRVGTQRQFSNFNYRVDLERQQGKAPETYTVGSPVRSYLSNGIVATVGYRPSQAITISGTSSLQAVETGGKSGTGRRYDLNIGYTPNERFGTSLTFSDSDSGGVSGLGTFSDGGGFGYGGSGFSSTTSGVSISGASALKFLNLSSYYRFSDRLTVSADLFTNRYSGSVTSNSETKGAGLSFTYDFNQDTRFSFRADTSTTKFIDITSSSSATTLSANLDGRLGKRWSYGLRGNILTTGGTSTFSQSGVSWESNVQYMLGKRQNLIFSLNNAFTTGYLPQSDLAAEIAYQYQLIDALALNIGYRHRNVRNRDDGVTSGAYRSGSFDIELSFNFGR
jgi:hypothetical protein